MNILVIYAGDRSRNSIALNCLAQDLPFLKQQIKLYGKIYNCRLVLTPSSKKKW